MAIQLIENPEAKLWQKAAQDFSKGLMTGIETAEMNQELGDLDLKDPESYFKVSDYFRKKGSLEDALKWNAAGIDLQTTLAKGTKGELYSPLSSEEITGIIEDFSAYAKAKGLDASDINISKLRKKEGDLYSKLYKTGDYIKQLRRQTRDPQEGAMVSEQALKQAFDQILREDYNIGAITTGNDWLSKNPFPTGN